MWCNSDHVGALRDSQIPAGVQSHHRIRLAGRGITRLDGNGLGDHYVHLKIRVPK